MVKIIGGSTPPRGRTIITTQAAAPPGPSSDTLDSFEKRVAETYARLVKAFEDGDEFVDIDLDEELPRELWLRILSAEDVSTDFGEQRQLRLTWDLDEENDDLLWVVISADGVEVARRDFESFLDEPRWTRTALRWLAETLGVNDPEQGRCVREVIPRR